MLELSVNCSENGTRLPNEDLRRPLPEAFFKIRNEKRVLSMLACPQNTHGLELWPEGLLHRHASLMLKHAPFASSMRYVNRSP